MSRSRPFAYGPRSFWTMWAWSSVTCAKKNLFVDVYNLETITQSITSKTIQGITGMQLYICKFCSLDLDAIDL